MNLFLSVQLSRDVQNPTEAGSGGASAAEQRPAALSEESLVSVFTSKDVLIEALRRGAVPPPPPSGSESRPCQVALGTLLPEQHFWGCVCWVVLTAFGGKPSVADNPQALIGLQCEHIGIQQTFVWFACCSFANYLISGRGGGGHHQALNRVNTDV